MSDPSIVELAVPGTQPEYHFPPYLSSIARSPRMPLVLLPETLTERTGPVFGHGFLRERDKEFALRGIDSKDGRAGDFFAHDLHIAHRADHRAALLAHFAANQVRDVVTAGGKFHSLGERNRGKGSGPSGDPGTTGNSG